MKNLLQFKDVEPLLKYKLAFKDTGVSVPQVGLGVKDGVSFFIYLGPGPETHRKLLFAREGVSCETMLEEGVKAGLFCKHDDGSYYAEARPAAVAVSQYTDAVGIVLAQPEEN